MSSNSASTLTGYQFFQGICQPEEPAAAVILPIKPSDAVQQKVAALQRILHTLMAADSGWPAEQPQTPETLLPYVTDEAEDLLEALQGELFSMVAVDAVANGSSKASPRHLKDLSADWLWAIAASSPLAMQLLEGVAANVEEWSQVYGLRLVPMLEVQNGDTTYTLDLTTQSWGSLVPAVAPETAIQLLELPTAPWVTAATVQAQLRDHSIALVPALASWFAGVTVNLCLPDTPWMTAQARLVLALMPLTMQVAEPKPTALEMPLTYTDTEATGLPTARVWQADATPTTVVETSTAILDVPAQAYPWTLDSELSFLEPTALTTALQAQEHKKLSQRVMTDGQLHADPELQTLLETVLSMSSEPNIWGLALDEASITLSELCKQVKWLWVQASQEYMPLMSGLPAQQLQSGRPWQSGTLMSQGQLVLQADGQAIAALDVASGEWITTAATLAATDLLHLSTALPLESNICSVERLTAVSNQMVAARSPLLASLMTAAPIKLWSPQDELFPDQSPPNLTLRWQVALTFSPAAV